MWKSRSLYRSAVSSRTKVETINHSFQTHFANMPPSVSQANLGSILRKIPPKWALTFIALVLAYWLLQPVVNRSLGWNLPSIAALIGDEKSEPSSSANPSKSASSPSRNSAGIDENFPSSDDATLVREKTVALDQTSPPAPTKPPSESTSKFPSKSPSHPIDAGDAKSSKPTSSTDVKNPPPSKTTAEKSTSKKQTATKREALSIDELARAAGVTGTSDVSTHGYLKSIGNEKFLSPSGLVYTRGSEEGHRLKHLARHLDDQPNRPGSHGVFQGSMPQVLKWIDEAYQAGKRKAPGARVRKDEEATIYEYTFAESIGYIGGSDGSQRNNPTTKRLRLVVQGQNVITAFPY